MVQTSGRRLLIIVVLLLAVVLGALAIGGDVLGTLDQVSSVGAFTLATILMVADRVQARRDNTVFRAANQSFTDAFLDWLVGGPRRLRRAAGALRRLPDQSGVGQQVAVSASDRSRAKRAKQFRRAVLLALRHDSAAARGWVTDERLRPSDDDLRRAFGARARHLHDLVRSDVGVLVSLVELAGRLGDDTLERKAGSGLADLLDRLPDDDVTRELRCHSEWWRMFFDRLPPEREFGSFEIALFRGLLGKAALLARTPAQGEAVVAGCLTSTDIEVVDAGVAVAKRFHDGAGLCRLQRHAGQLLEMDDRRDDALDRYVAALRACPAGADEMLAALVRPCLAGVQARADRHEYGAAAELVELVGERLAGVDHLGEARNEVARVREALVVEARQSLGDRVRRTAELDRPGVYRDWYRFEEAAGNFTAAACRAEDGGHLLSANRLFQRAGMYGEAVRVLRNDDSRESLNQRAEARAAGGDHFAAAEDYRRAGNWPAAAENYLTAKDYKQAVSCLLEVHQDRAIEEPSFVAAMRELSVDGLVRFCLKALTQRGGNTAALRELRQLRSEGNVSVALRYEVDEAIRRVTDRNRVAFEERAQAWTAEAVDAVNRRFAPTWGLDLGTSTCMVAIYDGDRGIPVLCRWRHDAGFPSTLCIDHEGRELVGLRGDELTVNRLRAILSNTKRDMGTAKQYAVGPSESYRPEEVAARLVRHGRMIVEAMLAGEVREQLASYARDALGGVEEEWLDVALREHPVQVERSKVLVTIPAYYPMMAKNATRDACVIAGVELVQLIHEPTAACIAATFERRQLSGRVVIVDFGAGTLDISLLEVEDRFYDVQSLSGETKLGSRDFDVKIAAALATQLRRSGETVPATPEARHRLEVAAEDLKKQLSTRTEADLTLYAFNGRDVTVRLTVQEMESVISELLQQLRQVCARARPTEKVDHLVLIGGPAHSPLVRARIQDAFGGLRPTPVAEPRTAVAQGAALQAAVLAGMLKDTLLLDVTPFSLGIKTTDADDQHQYTELVRANTTIPLKRTNTFTTHHDRQQSVRVEVYNGQLHRDFLLGQFHLDGIPPAARGRPQIDVAFEIDQSCVLTVTARNIDTGRQQGIRITDTTLLSPGDTERMRKRLELSARQREQTNELREAHRRLVDLLIDTDGLSVDQLRAQLQRRLDSLDLAADARLDAETARALRDVRIAAAETATSVRTASDRLAEARAHGRRAADRMPGPNLDAEVAELKRRERALRAAATHMTSLKERLTTWFVLLTQVDLAQEPVHLFRERYANGDYPGALTAAQRFDIVEPADQERRRHALAEVRDLTAYSAAVAEFRAADPQLSRASDFAPAVTVSSSTPRGATTVGGLLLDSDRVVTSREWLPAGGPVTVSVAGSLTVTGHASPDPGSDQLLVVRVSTPLPVPAPRLGYSALVRVGDSVEVPVTAAGRYVWTPALVEQFTSTNGERPATIQASLDGIDGSFTGRPVRNDLDEIVGIIVATRRFPGQATIITADTLRLVRDER
ncbi:Hsp70 family protein [Micromonospora ureilytica]|uniref:Hsp70 family protein n=1 Tax=Micromonospora ureilytica TaxID=709868 RepID=UPI002E13A62C|nr:Hsp70 family protein [Micromonospora ureilytica]